MFQGLHACSNHWTSAETSLNAPLLMNQAFNRHVEMIQDVMVDVCIDGAPIAPNSSIKKYTIYSTWCYLLPKYQED